MMGLGYDRRAASAWCHIRASGLSDLGIRSSLLLSPTDC